MKYIFILLFIVGTGLYIANQEQEVDNEVVDLDNLQGELIDPIVEKLDQKSILVNSIHSNTTNEKNSSDQMAQKTKEDELSKTKIVQINESEPQNQKKQPIITNKGEKLEAENQQEISENTIDNDSVTQKESEIVTTNTISKESENISNSDMVTENIAQNKSVVVEENKKEAESTVPKEPEAVLENKITETVKNEEKIALETVSNDETSLKTLKKKPLKDDKEEQEEYKPMSFQFLSSFVIGEEFSQQEMEKVPDYVRELEGKKIGIAGFMVPTDMTETEISQFLLVNMNDNCCFGGTPKITEFIYAELKGDKSKYTNFPIAIIGTFTINTNLEEKILYRMQVEQVISARDRIFWDIMKNAPKFPESQTEPYSYGSSFYQD